MGRYGLDAAVMDQYRCVCDSCCFAQERTFARVGLDQFDPGHTKDGQDEPREAGTAAEIHEAGRCRWDVGQELCRIEKMAAPDVIERVAADEIDARRPSVEQIGIGGEARQCFT